MALPMLPGEPLRLTTPLLIALVTLKGYEEAEAGKRVYIKDLAQHLVDLKEHGLDIGRIALDGLPGDYFSDDVSGFVYESILFGQITSRSPLGFTERIVTVCLNAFTERNDLEMFRPLLNEAWTALDIQRPRPF